MGGPRSGTSYLEGTGRRFIPGGRSPQPGPRAGVGGGAAAPRSRPASGFEGSLSPSGTRGPAGRGPGAAASASARAGDAGERWALCSQTAGEGRQVGPRRALPRPSPPARPSGVEEGAAWPCASGPLRRAPHLPRARRCRRRRRRRSRCPRRPRLPMGSCAQPGLASPDSPHDPWYVPARPGPASLARARPGPANMADPGRAGPPDPGPRPAPGARLTRAFVSLLLRSKMFIGGLSWQTTQGGRQAAGPRRPGRGTQDPGAPEPDTSQPGPAPR